MMRIRLAQEELDELKAAIEADDLVEAADALCDIAYINYGTIIEFGMMEIFPELFHEVHRSNMSKGHRTIEEATSTQRKSNGAGVAAVVKKYGARFIVIRKEDGKVLKPLTFAPPQLGKFLIDPKEL
jgi:hypothetical protein